MKFKTRRLTEQPPRLVGRHPSDYAQELQEWLQKIWQTATGSIPSGFNNIPALPIVAHAGTAGTESDGWAAADHEHDGRHNLLDGAIDQDTTPASPTKGNLIAGNGSSWIAVPVSSDGTILRSDSSAAAGVKWSIAVTAFDSAASDGTKGFLDVIGTLPAAPSANPFGTLASITSAGSAAHTQIASATLLNAGFSGASGTSALYASNAAQGQVTVVTSGAGGVQNNVGVYGEAISTASIYTHVGLFGRAHAGTGISVGVVGIAESAAAATANVGGLFNGGNSSGTNVGVYASLAPTASYSYSSAALLADNGAVAAPIAIFRDNGTQVFSIEDGGGLRVKAASLGSVTLDNANHVIRCDATAGAITLTLPVLAAANRGIWYRIKKIDASANTVTIAAGGGNTIDGAATSVLATQYTSEDVIAPDSGTDWAIFGVSSAASSGADDEARAMAFMAA